MSQPGGIPRVGPGYELDSLAPASLQLTGGQTPKIAAQYIHDLRGLQEEGIFQPGRVARNESFQVDAGGVELIPEAGMDVEAATQRNPGLLMRFHHLLVN